MSLSDLSLKSECLILYFFICSGEEEGVQGYKYTCEPGDVDWTPMNSNLHMQSIKVVFGIWNVSFRTLGCNWCWLGWVPMNSNKATKSCCLVIGRWNVPFCPKYIQCVFSVTRRSRRDEYDLLTHSLDVSIDLTDVTLVSDDTNRRLY